MSRPTWHPLRVTTRQGREATVAQIIEAIDHTAPGTKEELAESVGISEQYLSELLQEIKRDGIVRKAYVVDETAVYENAERISRYFDDPDGEGSATPDVTEPKEEGPQHRGEAVLELLSRLDDVTWAQYEAAWQSFEGEDIERPAGALESVTNERYAAVISELKSYTLTTDWPGNRVAADLATIATNLEIVGDRACFIADVIDGRERTATGIVGKRVRDIFEGGETINELFGSVLYEAELSAYDDLVVAEERIHRDLDELFELVTAYELDMYGYLVTVTRALERAIFYWVHAAETAVRLHSGTDPDHPRI